MSGQGRQIVGPTRGVVGPERSIWTRERSSWTRTWEKERTQRLPTSRRRGKLLSEDQEHAIVGLVIADNVIKLREIQTRIVEDNLVFHNVESISLTTIARNLSKHRVQMKQLSIVPFERNSERVKELRHQYVQRVMEVEANQSPHEIIYVEEAGFNLAKTCRRGRNIIGKRATVDVPGQRGEKYHNVCCNFKCWFGPAEISDWSLQH